MRKVLVLLSVVVATAGLLVGVFFSGLLPGDDLWPLAWLAWAPVGAMILYRRPGNGVGRTQMVIGLAWGLSFIALAVAVNAEIMLVRRWGDLISVVLGVVPWLGIVWLLLIFPSGRLTRRLEKITGTLVVIFGVFAVLAFALDSAPMESTATPSPLAMPELGAATEWIVSSSGFLIVVVLTFTAVISLVTRWRASSGIERDQYRWAVYGSIFFALMIGAGQFLPEDTSYEWLWLAAGAVIPAVIGVAVLRYRLYEIDRIISRTLAYLLLVGLLGSIFVVGAVWLPGVLIGDRAPEIYVAGSTLAVAALFNPVRKRVLEGVDRRFNRSRYDAEQVMEGFAGTLRGRIDVEDLVEGWVGVVAETMQPSSVSVWVRR